MVQVKCIQAFPSGFGCCPFLSGGSVVVDSLLIATPIVRFCNCFLFCCVLFCRHFIFAIISMGKRAGCFSLFVFRVPRDCFVALPHGATGLSAVCDCGIS